MSEHDQSLDAIMRTDRFVDALADGARMSSVDPLSAMLGAWRDEVRSRPDAQVVTLEQASAALAAPQKPSRSGRFGLTVVGAAAAAVLCVGGFGAIVYDAAPGDALYGLRSMIFGEPHKTRADAVVLAAQTELAQVQQLVQQGKWDEAQQKLVELAPTVQSVDDTQSRQALVQQYNVLTVQVAARDPQATLPPPGEPLPVLPSSPLTFLPPVVAAPSTPVSIPTTPTVPPVLIAPLPLPAEPMPTPTGPKPTPTGPLPTPTGPLPTPTGPLPTPTGPLPTPTGPLPKPTGPLPTPTVVVPRVSPEPPVAPPAPASPAPSVAPPAPASPAPAPAPPAVAPSAPAPAPASPAPTPAPAPPVVAPAAPNAPPSSQTPTTPTPSSQTPRGR